MKERAKPPSGCASAAMVFLPPPSRNKDPLLRARQGCELEAHRLEAIERTHRSSPVAAFPQPAGSPSVELGPSGRHGRQLCAVESVKLRSPTGRRQYYRALFVPLRPRTRVTANTLAVFRGLLPGQAAGSQQPAASYWEPRAVENRANKRLGNHPALAACESTMHLFDHLHCSCQRISSHCSRFVHIRRWCRGATTPRQPLPFPLSLQSGTPPSVLLSPQRNLINNVRRTCRPLPHSPRLGAASL